MKIIGQKGENVDEFHLRLEIYLNYYLKILFKTIIEIFDNFDHIYYLGFEPLSTPQSEYDPLGQKFELLIQVFDQLNTAKQKTKGLAIPLDSIYAG